MPRKLQKINGDKMDKSTYEVLNLSLNNQIESCHKQIIALRQYILEAEKEKAVILKEWRKVQGDDTGITEPESYNKNLPNQGKKHY